MKKTTGLYPRVRVDAQGRGVVSQAGGLLLTDTIRASGLDAVLSRTLAAWRKPLDEDLRPVPIGAIGEMWAGGACVTAGYLGNDLLTAERYRPDPFAGGLMFRTRDLARWTPDGRLEHHGRTDDQVKVRGFRVELDAVTAALESAPGCRQATTVLSGGRLVGFVTGADPDQARQAVATRLPYYCVPSEVLAVDTLPMTDRGKVDRRALLGAVR